VTLSSHISSCFQEMLSNNACITRLAGSAAVETSQKQLVGLLVSMLKVQQQYADDGGLSEPCNRCEAACKLLSAASSLLPHIPASATMGNTGSVQTSSSSRSSRSSFVAFHTRVVLYFCRQLQGLPPPGAGAAAAAAADADTGKLYEQAYDLMQEAAITAVRALGNSLLLLLHGDSELQLLLLQQELAASAATAATAAAALSPVLDKLLDKHEQLQQKLHAAAAAAAEPPNQESLMGQVKQAGQVLEPQLL
jgi:hypothetical protein